MILDEIVAKKEIRLKAIDKVKFKKLPKAEYSKNLFINTFINNDFTVIGEFKKASPSKGIILENFQIDKILEEYEKLPIGAYSVLTEEEYFLGKNEYLQYISSNTNKPLLRKDFIIEKYQINEAAYLGASAVLLIVAVLGDKLKDFYETAMNLGLAALVEVHNKNELEMALEIDADIIGINNRNLKDFTVDLATTRNLLQFIPKNKIVISESGLKTIGDIEYMKALGVNGVLIGETLIKNLNNQEFKEGLNNLLLCK